MSFPDEEAVQNKIIAFKWQQNSLYLLQAHAED